MATVTEALALAMEMTPEDRTTLARWLQRADRAGLALDAASIRESSEAQLRRIFDGAPA